MGRNGFLNAIMYTAISVFSLYCVLPVLLVVIESFTDESIIQQEGATYLPRKLSLHAYRLLFRNNSGIFTSYGISIFVTVVGTLSAVVITAMAAFALANKQVRYRNVLALFFFFTMIFNGGIVPWYIICNRVGLQNNVLALIIPTLIFSPFNLFLVRNYMNGIPDALMESARIDGAGDFRIAFRIYFPLCLPVLATVTLFYGLGYWNDWWNAIMLVDDSRLYPLQYFVFKLQSEVSMLQQLQNISSPTTEILPSETLKMATVVVTIGPIVFLYPYLQKYFIQGITIGSVKG